MENMLARAQELVAELNAKVAAVDKQQAEQNRKDAQLKADRAELDQFAITLASREAEVKKVENLQKLYQDAKALKAAAELAQSKLNGEVAAFKQEVQNQKALLNVENQKILNARALQARELESIKEQRAKLEEDKKNYKDQVIKEITAKVGK